MSDRRQTLLACLDAIWLKANAIRIAKHDQQTKPFAGEIMALAELATEQVQS